MTERTLLDNAPNAAHRHVARGNLTTRRYQQRIQAEIRSVAPIPPVINMRRRAQCRYSLKLYCETYFKPIFYFDWSVDQLDLIEELERVIIDGSNKAMALPRGGGKSSLCTIATNWAVSYGHRHYVYLIRDTQSNAEGSLLTIRRMWEQNQQLLEDFPEIAWPIRYLEGSHLRAKGQTFGEELTYVSISTSEMVFPYLYGYPYLESDINAAGAIISTTGITGSIRGSNKINPYTGSISRPDLVILDDVQTDAVAGSPASIERYIDLIDGAIKGMSGPGETIASIMPCTVIVEGDVSDTYLDPIHKPEWRGHRGKMVLTWPQGITDTEISDDTVPGKHWNEYAKLRVKSLIDHGDIRDATKYYKKHRKVMDEGFNVSWQDRFIKEGNNKELSAQQHAMNLRLENIITFLSEYQNNPSRAKQTDLVVMPTTDQIAERTTAIGRFQIPYYSKCLVAMVDVQDEMLWYTVCAFDFQYTGNIVDYGTFPKFGTHRTFTKAGSAKRKHLSHAFYTAHPSFPRDFSLRRDLMKPAPFEIKIRWAVEAIVEMLSETNRYTMADGTQMPINYIGIDCKWGASTDIIYKAVSEMGDSRLVPYEGTFIGATSRQMAEWARNKPGRVFEDQIHPDLNQCRWVKTPVPGTSIAKLASDVNSWKTFLMHRLVCPSGGVGCLQLFKSHPSQHELFSQHIAKSEYPLPVTARNKTVIEWKVLTQGGWPDNDYLDTTAGCMCLASLCGCRAPDDVNTVVASTTTESVAEQVKKATNETSEIVIPDSALKAATNQQRGTQVTGKSTGHHSHQRKKRSMAAEVEARKQERMKAKQGISNLSR